MTTHYVECSLCGIEAPYLFEQFMHSERLVEPAGQRLVWRCNETGLCRHRRAKKIANRPVFGRVPDTIDELLTGRKPGS